MGSLASSSSSGGGGGGGDSSVYKGVIVAGKGRKKGVFVQVGKKKLQYISPKCKAKARMAKVPSHVEVGKKKFKVVSVASYSFTGFDNLKVVVVGKGVKKVAKKAFFGCPKKLKVVRK